MDAAEFECVVNNYDAYVRKVLSCRGCPDDELENLMQETWLKAWDKRLLFDPERGALATWISSIAKNVLLEFWRSQRREVKTVSLCEISADQTQDLIASGTAAEIAFRCDLEKVTTPGDKPILPLLEQGLTAPEIAKQLGLNLRTCEDKIARLRRRVNKYLARPQGKDVVNHKYDYET